HVLLVHGDGLGHALGTLARVGDLRVVQLVGSREQLGGHLVLPLVAHLLVEAADNGFVCCGHLLPPVCAASVWTVVLRRRTAVRMKVQHAAPVKGWGMAGI